jgi:hypothetical protein
MHWIGCMADHAVEDTREIDEVLHVKEILMNYHELAQTRSENHPFIFVCITTVFLASV